jgi:hypothetical protein
MASEPRERSAPAKRRARERVGESEGQSPSVKTCERARRASRRSGVGIQGAPASDGVGESEGRSPSVKK